MARILFIIDPLASLKAHKDSSVAMMRVAAQRGHDLWVAEPSQLRTRWPAAHGCELSVLATQIEVLAGPTASADAAVTAGMFSELADDLDYDSQRAGGPHLTTGVHFDDLRTRAFDMRCRGQKIGDRQPRAREAIKAYLDAKVGVSGGPVSPEQRTAWVAALREIGRAAGDASR
jgi:hypothetical protein